MKKIIIDTDPGVDDSLALLLAISSNLNIIGITTIYGNSTIKNTTKNTLSVLQILNSNIPVYQGSSKPLFKKPILPPSHGKNGLVEFSLKNLQRKKENITAIQFLINSLEKNKDKEIDILCLGPTTNLALLKIKRPDLIKKINQIIILGGVFFEEGNIASKAEFNVFSDPEALDLILSFECQKTLIPINVCQKVIFTLKDFNKINNPKIASNFKIISNKYINYYQNDPIYGKFKGGIMYDLLVICFLINKEIFKTQNKYITVNSKGQTKIKNKKQPNCCLVTSANPKKIKNTFFNNINSKLSI